MYSKSNNSVNNNSILETSRTKKQLDKLKGLHNSERIEFLFKNSGIKLLLQKGNFRVSNLHSNDLMRTCAIANFAITTPEWLEKIHDLIYSGSSIGKNIKDKELIFTKEDIFLGDVKLPEFAKQLMETDQQKAAVHIYRLIVENSKTFEKYIYCTITEVYSPFYLNLEDLLYMSPTVKQNHLNISELAKNYLDALSNLDKLLPHLYLDEKLFKESPKDNDTTYHIMSFLPQKTLSSFVFNKNCYYAVQPQRIEDAFVRYVSKGPQKTVEEMLSKHPQFKIHHLLGHIALGNQDEAEKMLKETPELLLQSGSVIDPSGRFFKKIKPFELILWTLDVRYMGEMVLQCVDASKNRDAIRIELLKQYNTIIEDFSPQTKTGGVHYTLNGKPHHEKHFDFQPLIKALGHYVNNYDVLTSKECENYWCKVVGKEQSMLPMHVRHHYCDPDESFEPSPTFTKKRFIRHLRLEDSSNPNVVVWISNGIDLGVNSAILRTDSRVPQLRGLPKTVDVRVDFHAVNNLGKRRIEDLKLLKNDLGQAIEKSERIQKSF